MIDAAELGKTLRAGDQIYHYTTSRTCIESILFDRRLRFSPLSRTNDPLEYQDFIHAATGTDTTKEQLAQLIYKGFSINEMVKHSCKICCFSIDAEPGSVPNATSLFHKGYAKSRMWSQYADYHRGVCMVFSLNRLYQIVMTETESVNVPMESHVSVFHGIVEYDNYLRKLNDALDIEYTPEEISKSEIQRVGDNAQAYLFSKLEDYKDEQEYRIVLHSSKGFLEGESTYVRFLDALQCVILGCSFPIVYEQNIVSFSKKLGFGVVKMNWLHGIPYLRDIGAST